MFAAPPVLSAEALAKADVAHRIRQLAEKVGVTRRIRQLAE